MRINDILIESQVKEAPQGMLKRAGLGIMSKFGSDKAAGKLDTGAIANALMRDFNRFLGATKLEPDADAVLRFLQSKGYPSDGAKMVLDKEANAAAGNRAPTGPMGGGIMGKMKGAAGSLGNRLKANPEQPQDRIEPTGDDDATATAQPSASQAQPTTAAQPTTKPSASQTQTPAQQNTNKIDKKARQAAGNPAMATQQAAADAQNKPGWAQTADDKIRIQAAKGVNANAAGSFKAGAAKIRSKGLNMSMYTEEALPQATLDKAFMQAAHDAAKMGYGLDPNTGNITGQGGAAQGPMGGGDQGAAQGGGGAWDNFKQGFAGGLTGQQAGDASGGGQSGVQGSLNVNALSQLMPSVNPAQLKMAVSTVKSGGQLSRTHQATLSAAMVDLMRADPATTQKAFTLLKRIQA